MMGLGGMGSLAPWALQSEAPSCVGQLEDVARSPAVLLLGIEAKEIIG